MLKKISCLCYLAIFSLLVISCQQGENQLEKDSAQDQAVNELEFNTFSEDYLPGWWNNLKEANFLYSYDYSDGSDKASIKDVAIKTAQAKLLHYKKDYVVNLTALILKESNSKDKFKSRIINAKSQRVYEKDYSQYMKIEKSDFIDKENGYRCFVAVKLPVDAIQREYVNIFNKDKSYAKAFQTSETYRYLLKQAGINAEYKDNIVAKQEAKKEIKESVNNVKYDADIVPAWFKISYNNKKVMVNQTSQENSQEKSIQKAKLRCEKQKMQTANNFARAEAEKYRELSQYNEVEFAKLKNQISQEVMKENYPIAEEFTKTIRIGKNTYKTYAQYSIKKKSIQETIIKVLKSDEVLYSRLKASMAFDELEAEEF